MDWVVGGGRRVAGVSLEVGVGRLDWRRDFAFAKRLSSSRISSSMPATSSRIAGPSVGLEVMVELLHA